MKTKLTAKEIRAIELRLFNAIVKRNRLRHVAGAIYFDPKSGSSCIPFVNVDDLTREVAKAQRKKMAA